MSASLHDADEILRRWFGYPALRAPQRTAIAAVLGGTDTLVVMPTGGGKSLCFQVPALMLDGLTVVLSPLVSLMKDQVDTLVRKGVPAVGVHGGMTAGEQADAIAAALTGRARLLYVAPERLVTGSTLRALSRVRVAMLAVDEAHCISEWGHDFRPAYRELQHIRAPLGDPVTIALTATATPEVRRDIARVCRLRNPVRVIAGFDRPNLRYAVRRVARPRHRDALVSGLVAARRGPAVVYAQTRSRVERLARLLRRAAVPALAYHAGQDGALRRRTQDRFMAGDADVIVATSAFGMGVDKPDVRLVVHDAISPSLESYYQEAGRAGRDGRESDCVLLYAAEDRRSPEHFIAAAAPRRVLVESVYAAARLSDGQAPLDVAALARAVRSSPALVAGVLGFLRRCGAVVDDSGDRARIWTRLLATPERIAQACDPRGAERALLRTLWKASAGGIARGAILPLDALPPGLGHVGLVAALDDLARRSLLMWTRPDAGLRLADRDAPIERWTVDWEALDARRRVAVGRLAAMVRYAEADGCRRRILLGYFGDRLPAGPCGRCDRCAGCGPRR